MYNEVNSKEKSDKYGGKNGKTGQKTHEDFFFTHKWTIEMTNSHETEKSNPLEPYCRMCSQAGIIHEIENHNLWLVDVPENYWALEPAHTATICESCADGFDIEAGEWNIRKPDIYEMIEFGKQPQVKALRLALQTALIKKCSIFESNQIYIDGFGEDVKAYIELDDPDSDDYESLYDGCNLRVFLDEHYTSPKWRDQRAKQIKHSIWEKMHDAGIVNQPPPEDWEDVVLT